MPECVVCGSRHVTRAARQPLDYEYRIVPRRPHAIFSCSTCGACFLYPRPGLNEVASFYPRDYYAYAPRMTPIVRMLYEFRYAGRTRYFPRAPGRRELKVFDVGCGDGRQFEIYAKHVRCRCYGVELNPSAARTAQSKGYRVVEGDFETFATRGWEGRFDLVTMNHFIEHALDPRRALKKAFSLLNDTGIILGTTPVLDCHDHRLFRNFWGGYHFPRHLQIFSSECLENLLKEHPFKEIIVKREINLITSISVQNLLSHSFGIRPALFRRNPLLGGIPLFAGALVSLLETALGKGGCILFLARRQPEAHP